MFQNLPGFRDFFPEECAVRNHLFRVFRQTAKHFNFREYDGPILEPLDLFREKSGDEIVSQLFAFTDQGGREVALRPEMTPTLARMIGAKANALKRPIKWFCITENFRYERQQKGRTRSFYQFNGDVFGEVGPAADAEVIAMMIATLYTLGLGPEDFVIRLSDRHLWVYYLEAIGLGEEAIPAILGLVDKKERMPREVLQEKLKPYFGEAAEDFLIKIDTLTEIRELADLKQFFADHIQPGPDRDKLEERLSAWDELLRYLNGMGYQRFIRIDLSIVRGLAYYTGFVFEAFDIQGAHRAVCGGGRYDHLVKKLGGPDMPAVGFAMGDVVLGNLLEEKGLLPEYISMPDVYVIFGGAAEREAGLLHVQLMRQAGISVEYPMKQQGFGKQFKNAGASGARLTVVFGEEELAQQACKVKDMQSGEEEQVSLSRLIADVTTRLRGE